MKNRKLDTICVQGAYVPKSGEARVCPVNKSTTFYYEKARDMADLFDLKSEGFFYSRIGNPTLDAFEGKLGHFPPAKPTIMYYLGYHFYLFIFKFHILKRKKRNN